MTSEEARVRVGKGAAFLDAWRPNWWQQINVDKLQLSSPCFCVLGQLEGSFWGACVRLGWTTPADQRTPPGNPARELGFSGGRWYDDDPRTLAQRERDHQEFFGLLQDAWIEAIAARKFPDVPARSTAPAPATNAVREETGQPVVSLRE